MSKDVDCPYCGKGQEINHDDGQAYSESETHEQECTECEKVFAFYTSVSFDYQAHKADCLNGGEHNWRNRNSHPPFWPHARDCTDCGLRDNGEVDMQAWEEWNKKG